MLSSSLSLPSQRQYLQQKVSILQEEIQQYKLKQTKRNRLNESILQTYKENENYRESRQQKLQNDLRQTNLRYKQQIRKLKNQHTKEKAQLQQQNSTLKQKLRTIEQVLQKVKLEGEKSMIELKGTLENKHWKHINQIETNYNQKLAQLAQNNEQLAQANLEYQEYIERKMHCLQNDKTQKSISNRIQRRITNDYLPLIPKRIQNKQNYQFGGRANIGSHRICELSQNNFMAKKVLKSSKKLISQLTTRINRATNQISQSKKPRLS